MEEAHIGILKPIVYPFYMATKSHKVARNLLKYRYDHLEKAIENAEKLGFKNDWL